MVPSAAEAGLGQEARVAPADVWVGRERRHRALGESFPLLAFKRGETRETGVSRWAVNPSQAPESPQPDGIQLLASTGPMADKEKPTGLPCRPQGARQRGPPSGICLFGGQAGGTKTKASRPSPQQSPRGEPPTSCHVSLL